LHKNEQFKRKLFSLLFLFLVLDSRSMVALPMMKPQHCSIFHFAWNSWGYFFIKVFRSQIEFFSLM